MRTEKGQPGYVKARKQKYLLDRIQTESAYRCSGSRMPSGSKDVGGIYHNGTI